MSASKVAFHCLTRSREVNGLLACLLKGTYNQTMDAKGRMTFPTKLRELIGERFIVTKGIDGCLFVYSLEDFEKRAEKIRSLPMAGLEKEIVVAGVSDRCEIWDKKRWDDFNSSIDDNELMEALEGLDF